MAMMMHGSRIDPPKDTSASVYRHLITSIGTDVDVDEVPVNVSPESAYRSKRSAKACVAAVTAVAAAAGKPPMPPVKQGSSNDLKTSPRRGGAAAARTAPGSGLGHGSSNRQSAGVLCVDETKVGEDDVGGSEL